MVKKYKNIKIDYDESKTLSVEYLLIQSIIDNNIIYGFKINSMDLDNKICDSKEFLDFTKDLDYAENIFDILINNKVLPLNLTNVLDDMID